MAAVFIRQPFYINPLRGIEIILKNRKKITGTIHACTFIPICGGPMGDWQLEAGNLQVKIKNRRHIIFAAHLHW